MADLNSIIARIRREIGDSGESFQSVALSDGQTVRFDLPVGLVEPGTLSVMTLSGATATTLDPSAYTLSGDDVLVLTGTPPAAGTQIIVSGMNYNLFTDAELTQYVQDAIDQHTHGQVETVRYWDEYGFIQYARNPVGLANLPEVEEYPVALLATIQALWTLATDASTDIDVTTAEGTHIPRSQRFAQIRSQIEALTERYNYICAQLNIGLGRIEVGTLRRVSRTTNRLVPIFVEREFDDHAYPERVLPPVGDANHHDESGIPSPAYGVGPW